MLEAGGGEDAERTEREEGDSGGSARRHLELSGSRGPPRGGEGCFFLQRAVHAPFGQLPSYKSKLGDSARAGCTSLGVPKFKGHLSPTSSLFLCAQGLTVPCPKTSQSCLMTASPAREVARSKMKQINNKCRPQSSSLTPPFFLILAISLNEKGFAVWMHCKF